MSSLVIFLVRGAENISRIFKRKHFLLAMAKEEKRNCDEDSRLLIRRMQALCARKTCMAFSDEKP